MAEQSKSKEGKKDSMSRMLRTRKVQISAGNVHQPPILQGHRGPAFRWLANQKTHIALSTKRLDPRWIMKSNEQVEVRTSFPT